MTALHQDPATEACTGEELVLIPGVLGSAVYVYGTVGPDYGSASINLDGRLIAPNMNLGVSCDLAVAHAQRHHS